MVISCFVFFVWFWWLGACGLEFDWSGAEGVHFIGAWLLFGEVVFWGFVSSLRGCGLGVVGRLGCLCWGFIFKFVSVFSLWLVGSFVLCVVVWDLLCICI